MNILVTGGTGFLGKALARRLKTLGHNVSAMGRNDQVGIPLEKEGISFIKADLSSETEVAHAIKDQDIVFHCGALSSPWANMSIFMPQTLSVRKMLFLAVCNLRLNDLFMYRHQVYIFILMIAFM